MASLSLAEIANKGITLITTAYLARVISPEGYGIIGFATSFVAYFVFLVSLGFDTVGSRETAKPENSIPKYVNSILSIRFLLSVAAYAVLATIVILLDKPLMVKYVLLIAGLNIFSNALLLNWLFIGIEKMEIIALRQIITGLLNLAGVVIFVHGYADTITAMAVMAGSLALNTGWMLVYYIKKFGRIKFDFDLPFWKILFRSSIMIGMAFFIVVITNNLNMVMLGFMRTDYETGLYNAAYKLLLLSLVPSQVIQNAFFPNFSRMKAEDDRKNIMEKYNLLLFFSGTFIAVFLIVFSDFVVETTFGEAYTESAEIGRASCRERVYCEV